MNKTILPVALALLCTACTGSLLESDLPVTVAYVLAPAPATPATVAATRADLSIGRPDFTPGLDTDRIAVLKGRQLDYYRGARWSGRTADVVQALLVGTLEDQKLFRSVTSEQARVAGDYVLDVEVRHFQAEYERDDAAPAAHVMLVARLIRIVDRKLVDTFASSARMTANDNHMRAVTAAFESAAQKVALEIAQHTASVIASDEPALRAARGEGDVSSR